MKTKRSTKVKVGDRKKNHLGTEMVVEGLRPFKVSIWVNGERRFVIFAKKSEFQTF